MNNFTKMSSLDVLLASIRDDEMKFTRLPKQHAKKSQLDMTRFAKKVKSRSVKVA